MKHPISVEGYEGLLDELARAVGRMRYDKVAEFLKHLAMDIQRQAEGDAAAGRTKLAAMLRECSAALTMSHKDMVRIYRLCEPYMKND